MKKVNYLKVLAVLMLFATIITGCKKDDDDTAAELTVTTSDVTNITATTATAGGTVTYDNKTELICGLCWSINENPTLSDSYSTKSIVEGSFSSEMTGLTAETSYFVRAYASLGGETVYGEQKSFTTLANGGGGGGGDEPGDGVAEVNETFDSYAEYDTEFTGWVNIATEGDRQWNAKVYNSNVYAQSTGYNSGLASMVTWLITPKVKIDQTKYLRFETAKAYWEHTTGNPCSVLISTDFDGTNIATSTWTEVTGATIATQSSADNTFIESGDVDLSAYIGQNIYVAFKYTGSGTESTTYRIDNVYIGTEPGTGGGGGGGGDEPGSGSGTQDDPYTIADVIGGTATGTAWVKAYVVGQIIGMNISGAEFSEPWSTAEGQVYNTNVLLADNMSETNANNCAPLQLPVGEIRNGVNLPQNPSNYNQEILLYGTIQNYFGVPGVKTPTYVVINGNTYGIEPGGGDDALFFESFAGGQGSFTIENVLMPSDLTYVWSHASSYSCMKASAYVGSAFETESWLISPAIDMSSVSTATLTFDHAVNYLSNPSSALSVLVSTDYTSGDPSSATWTEVSVPSFPLGNDWTFISSGASDISSVAGNSSVHIAFKYTSTTATAATWEVKNVMVE